MALVEDPPAVVVERAGEHPAREYQCPKFGVDTIIRPPGTSAVLIAREELDRLADVLDDVGGDHDVERAAELGEATVEVPEAEVVDPVADAGLLHHVDAGHVVAEVANLLGQQPRRAPDVEDL